MERWRSTQKLGILIIIYKFKKAKKMENDELFGDITETMNHIAQGDKTAMEALESFKNTKGLARKVLVSRTLPELKEKAIYGAFFGALWKASDKDIMIFTKVLTVLPTPYCLLAGCLSTIDDTFQSILNNIGQKVIGEAKELGIYRKDKSIYNQESYIHNGEIKFPRHSQN